MHWSQTQTNISHISERQKTIEFFFSLQCNRLLRWCPSTGCTYAIKVLYADARPAKCKCGHDFCFECGENWHDPVQCDLLKKWMQKCSDDSETSNWIAANTKDCPKCKATIEKNGGCNHMVNLLFIFMIKLIKLLNNFCTVVQK